MELYSLGSAIFISILRLLYAQNINQFDYYQKRKLRKIKFYFDLQVLILII